MRELKFKFFHVNKEKAKLKESEFLTVKAPFLEEISGLGIINLLGLDT